MKKGSALLAHAQLKECKEMRSNGMLRICIN
jgi:hypothetical protein